MSRSDPGEHSPAWEEEYEALLRKAERRSGKTLTGEGDRRRHPRFRVRGNIGVQLEAQLPAINLSAEGVSFRSAMAIPVGKRIGVVLAQAILSEVEVLACEEEAVPNVPLYRWRIHGHFVHPGEGLRILIMLDSMGNLDLSDPA